MGGLHFFDVQVFREKDSIWHRFWEGLGEGFGRVLDVKNVKKGIQERFKIEAEKR